MEEVKCALEEEEQTCGPRCASHGAFIELLETSSFTKISDARRQLYESVRRGSPAGYALRQRHLIFLCVLHNFSLRMAHITSLVKTSKPCTFLLIRFLYLYFVLSSNGSAPKYNQCHQLHSNLRYCPFILQISCRHAGFS